MFIRWCKGPFCWASYFCEDLFCAFGRGWGPVLPFFEVVAFCGSCFLRRFVMFYLVVYCVSAWVRCERIWWVVNRGVRCESCSADSAVAVMG